MSLTIRTQLKEKALNLAKNRTLTEVRIGLGYTAVQLDNGQIGVACTLHHTVQGNCTIFKGSLPLQGQPASKILEMLDAPGPVESAVSLATSNALFNTSSPEMLTGDILDNVTLYPDDHVGMVGLFAPLIPLLISQTERLDVFEKKTGLGPPASSSKILPAEAALDILPQCQVAVITATSIINHTIDKLLRACTQCREVILLGASTPLMPEVFSETPITVLSGVIVTNPPAMLQVVSEGGGTKLFTGHTRKVNLKLKQ